MNYLTKIRNIYTRRKMIWLLAVLAGCFFTRYPGWLKNKAYVLYRQAARGQLLLETGGWQQAHSQHFLLRYQSSDAAYARMVLETAEEFYRPVFAAYNVQPRQKILLVLYPDARQLGAGLNWPSTTSAIGVYWGGVVRVLSPAAWLAEISPEQLAGHFKQNGPLAHELTHYAVDWLAAGNCPRWLTEGLAQYEEWHLTGFEMPAGEGERETTLPLAELDKYFDTVQGESLAYRQSFLLVRYLMNVYGREQVQEILRQLGKGQTIERAVRQALGISLVQLERDWRAAEKL
ncbi:peptidase MA family metallohydrolase [Desulfurispora thermophila]|uniref:peptidase MA family metallohydrolase n=1 Tax=Desulfurispora thermophila TaxID=265470 RepID=UPI000379481C|nr:peptidase MA family metallohydrolase [Desulfurispora thermophila]